MHVSSRIDIVLVVGVDAHNEPWKKVHPHWGMSFKDNQVLIILHEGFGSWDLARVVWVFAFELVGETDEAWQTGLARPSNLLIRYCRQGREHGLELPNDEKRS